VGYEKPQIMMMVCLLLPFLYMKKKKEKPTEQKKDFAEVAFIMPAFVGSWSVLLAVLYMSDLGLWNAAAQGILGAIFGLALMIRSATQDTLAEDILTKETLPEQTPAEKQTAGKEMAEVDIKLQGKVQSSMKGIVLFMMITLALTNIFGKGFTVKFGKTQTNTILGIRNVVRTGPAKGIFSHYMLGYIMDSDYEDFLSNVEPGSKVLIVTNMVEGAGTSPYMFADYEICHFSIVDPTSYDEKLLTYWECYPEKKPDVIVVDCWYGQLMEDPGNWIMQYIENDFEYQQVTDGKYVRFYKK